MFFQHRLSLDLFVTPVRRSTGISLGIRAYTANHREAALLCPARGHFRRKVKKNTKHNLTGDCPVVPRNT